jgi:hypothetical protein
MNQPTHNVGKEESEEERGRSRQRKKIKKKP